jgi:hypothetical protein
MIEDKNTVKLQLGENALASMICCTAIGLLEAIRAKKIPAEWGIWTLAMPKFWAPLEENDLLSPKLLQTIQTFDEIDFVVGHMDQAAAEEMISGLLDVLYSELKAYGLPTMWDLKWEIERRETL